MYAIRSYYVFTNSLRELYAKRLDVIHEIVLFVVPPNLVGQRDQVVQPAHAPQQQGAAGQRIGQVGVAGSESSYNFV